MKLSTHVCLWSALLALGGVIQSTSAFTAVVSPRSGRQGTGAASLTTQSPFSQQIKPVKRQGMRSHAASPLYALQSKKVQTALTSNNAFRGKLLIIVSKLFVSPAKYWDVLGKVVHQTYWPEIALIAALIKARPLAKWWYARRHADLLPKDKDDKTENGDSENEEKIRDDTIFQKAFLASKTYKLAIVLRQVGLLQAALYASDVFLVILKHLDFSFVVKYQAQQVAGSILLACWMAHNTSRLKYHYLQRRTTTTTVVNGEWSTTTGSSTPRTLNRLTDIFIYACAFLTVVDLLGMEIGFALKSIFGLGSFGTLALSLASKDLAAEFVGGLMIQASNFFNEGETVVLQDGTKGSVAKIGWLHTYIYKQEENTIVRVPNSQISHQRISRARRAPTKRGRRTF